MYFIYCPTDKTVYAGLTPTGRPMYARFNDSNLGIANFTLFYNKKQAYDTLQELEKYSGITQEIHDLCDFEKLVCPEIVRSAIIVNMNKLNIPKDLMDELITYLEVSNNAYYYWNPNKNDFIRSFELNQILRDNNISLTGNILLDFNYYRVAE
ncbi:MAG: hypothetical protein M0R17_00930 [Candidatus Omnitrophica bacterium]|jgi:hypothetical protein|nr:hypothetical protein [Candidatus Omnitrophota bacterium]